MRTWSLSYGQDGTTVSLTEVPFWAWAAQEIGEGLDVLSEKVTGLCLINPPEWMFALRWGALDEDGYTPRSAGSVLYRFGQQLMNGFGAYRREKTIAHLPVSSEWVREHRPDAGWPWDGTDSETEHDGEGLC